MWIYEKKLQFPVNIKRKDLRMAKYLMTQYGGPNGELAAAWRYLNSDTQCQMTKERPFLQILAQKN